MNVQTLKGFRDFLPETARKRQYVMNTLKGVFESFGFEPLETPALEYEEILLGKYGEEGDKLMYRFTDNGERKVALRYDQTVPTARVVSQYQNELPNPFKRYQIQNVWRAENTQKGRYREFVQCDADIIGTGSPLSDAEIILVAAKGLQKLGFVNFKVLINDRNVFSDLALKANIPADKLSAVIRALDKLKKIGEEKVLAEFINSGLDPEIAESIMQHVESLVPNESLQTIFTNLEKMGLNKSQFEFSPTLARGLDYYTGVIFEIEVEGYPGSLCGGGRYDKLIGIFAGRDIAATGFAYGFDRIIETMDEQKLFPTDLQSTKVLVTIFSSEIADRSVEISSKLRDKNIATELWLDPNIKLEKQLKYADQKGIPFAAIIGPDEQKNNTVTLKDLKNKSQETLTLDELVQKLSS